MVFAYVFVQGWIIDPYEHWFFVQPGEILLFPAHYTEVIQGNIMTHGVTVIIDRGEGFQVFLVSLSKCSSCLTYVLLITFQPIVFVSINYATLFLLSVLCPLVPPVHLLCSCHSWNELKCHISCRCSSHSDINLHCMTQLYDFCWWFCCWCCCWI